MIYSLGIIPYINMEPYRQIGVPLNCKFVYLVPKKTVLAIKSNKILAGAVPVGALSSLNDLVEPIGTFGIAAKNYSMSVLLFSDIPFYNISKKHKIKLTPESMSSIKLLYLLLSFNNNFNNLPTFINDEVDLDGELIIGNNALLNSKIIYNKSNILFKSKKEWEYVTDLANIWYCESGYPFVFARWVVRKDAPIFFKNLLFDWLCELKKRENDLVNNAINLAVKSLKISSEDMKFYFKFIRCPLDYYDLFGQKLFKKLSKKCDNLSLFKI